MKLKIIKANVIKYLVPPPNLNDTVSVLSRRERDTQKEKTNMQKRNGIYKGK